MKNRLTFPAAPVPSPSRGVLTLGLLTLGLSTLGLSTLGLSTLNGAEATKYARFSVGNTIAYGIVEGQRIRQLDGDLFGDWKKTDQTFALKEVKLLVPTRPTQVLALAGNYRSHLNSGATITTITTTTRISHDPVTGENSTSTTTEEVVSVPGQVPEKFQIPQPFFKSPSCLVAHDGEIVIPKAAETVHFEAELVIVIGKTAQDVPKAAALDYVFGVTCGNDVSARVWQRGDHQWWRAKGSDSFGPCGPFIVSGLDYDDLLMRLKLNGEVKQEEGTSNMIHDVASTVSFISQHVTLHPGDLIFTGTSGKTAAIQPGDIVEVEMAGIATLRNRVVAEK